MKRDFCSPLTTITTPSYHPPESRPFMWKPQCNCITRIAHLPQRVSSLKKHSPSEWVVVVAGNQLLILGIQGTHKQDQRYPYGNGHSQSASLSAYWILLPLWQWYWWCRQKDKKRVSLIFANWINLRDDNGITKCALQIRITYCQHVNKRIPQSLFAFSIICQSNYRTINPASKREIACDFCLICHRQLY